jgi:hypothetical protein
MKNQQLITELFKSIAPAVTKFHLDLQLSSKTRDDSEYSVSTRTIQYIAEDTMDIALELAEELELSLSSQDKKIAPVKTSPAKTAPTKTAPSKKSTPTKTSSKK